MKIRWMVVIGLLLIGIAAVLGAHAKLRLHP